MDKKTDVEKRFIIILLCILAVSLCWGLKSAGLIKLPARAASPSSWPPSPPSPAGDLAHPITPAVREVQNKTKSQVQPAASTRPSRVALTDRPTYTASTLRDPLQSLFPGGPKKLEVRPSQEPGRVTAPSPGEGRLPTLTIQGLIWGGPKPKAIIDNEVYGVGDIVQGATITEIGPEGITLELQGRTIRVALPQGLAKDSAPFATHTLPGTGR